MKPGNCWFSGMAMEDQRLTPHLPSVKKSAPCRWGSVEAVISPG
jgi:hypothetical protein